MNEKVFNQSEGIKKNLVGYIHDRGSNLSGSDGGLGVLLAKEVDHFFYDLSDPCHSLNLAISNSLEILPKEILNFVEKIHSYFSYPRRIAKLKNIQKTQDGGV